MVSRLLIIDNYDSFTYNLVDLIRSLKVAFKVITIENLPLEQLNEFSHILISPGPDTPKAYPDLFMMLERCYLDKAILGVCLGHQTICQFFGANLYNLSDVRHGHSGILKLQSDCYLFSGLPKEFRVGLYHSWAVSTQNFPQELEVTAFCDNEIIMAFRHKKLPIFGVQFHPESYISQYGKEILRNFLQQ